MLKKLSLAIIASSLLASPVVSAPYNVAGQASQEREELIFDVNNYVRGESIDHFELIERAENGDEVAAWYASQMYHLGILVDKDVRKATKLAQLAAINGNADAQDYLSRHPGLSRDDQMYWSNKGASASHPKSLFDLGKAYLESDGVPRDIDLALFYLSRSADLGHEPAQRLKQDILDQQIQLPSFQDILENARSGQIDALKRLAEAYRNGILIDRNIAKAELIDAQINKLSGHAPNHTVNAYE